MNSSPVSPYPFPHLMHEPAGMKPHNPNLRLQEKLNPLFPTSASCCNLPWSTSLALFSEFKFVDSRVLIWRRSSAWKFEQEKCSKSVIN